VRTYAKISTVLRAVHQWSGCTIKSVDFLRHPHHHEFKIIVLIEQFHDDRDIEYISFQRRIDSFLQINKKLYNSSCEMLAKKIKEYVERIHPDRDVKVEVNEDGYYGAVVENEINIDVHWLSGFIDGEGSLGLAKGHHNCFVPFFSVGNTNFELISRCQKIINKYTGRLLNIHSYKHRNGRSRIMYSIYLSSRKDLLSLCSLIIPFLYGKRHQAILIRDLLNRHPRGKGSGVNYMIDHSTIYNKLKKLNSTGIKED
jgi:hypothetical protein